MRHAVLLVVLLVASPAWAQSGDTSGANATTSSGAAAPPPAREPVQTAPPPAQPPPAPREEQGDGRSADLIWIEGLFGYSYVNLVQFSQDNFLPSVDRYKANGWTAGVAAGLRVAILMIGARGTLASYPGFEVGTATGEVHLRLPAGSLEPYARVGFGYAWVGNANYNVPEQSETSVYGLVLDASAGLDVYLDKIVALGVGIDGAWLNLSRQRLDEDQCAPDCVGEVSFTSDGDAAGLQLRLHGHISLHF